MRASRLLSILILLQVRGRVSAEALAREFEVSVRTIYRDMDQLSAAGAPVYAERGRTGGFALLDGYRTKLTGMTAEEAETLVLAGAGRAAADLGRAAALSSAQLKLLASLPGSDGTGADRVARRFHLDAVGWYRRAETPEALPALAEAVWSDRRIRVRYERWSGEVEREIDPLGLVMKAGAWYLVGAVKGEVRTYRVGAIRALEVLETAARRPSRFDLADWWADWARDFETRLLDQRAEVRLSPEGLKVLRVTSPAAAQAAETDGRVEADGWLRAVVPVEGLADATRQMMHLGAEVEVIGPPELRAAVVGAAEAVARRHRRP